MENERILCASPGFLGRYGAPRTFADLANFSCLRTSDSGGRNAWRSVEEGEDVAIDASGNFEGNSADVVYNAALAGLGIARLSSYLVADSIRSGALVRVLPDYTQKNADIAVIFAERRLLAPRIRVFVDFLAQHFRGRGPLAPDAAVATD
jgi:DNA-binding transcriptional LysR family regulator